MFAPEWTWLEKVKRGFLSRSLLAFLPHAPTAPTSLESTFNSNIFTPSTTMITHIVHFAYKPEIASNERQLLASRFLLLLESCQRDGQPYILSLTGGKQNSKEGVDKGLEVRQVPSPSLLARLLMSATALVRGRLCQRGRSGLLRGQGPGASSVQRPCRTQRRGRRCYGLRGRGILKRIGAGRCGKYWWESRCTKLSTWSASCGFGAPSSAQEHRPRGGFSRPARLAFLL